MAKEKNPRGSDTKLAWLHAVRNQQATLEITLELRRYLADASSLIVAETARIIGDQAVLELVGDLVAAFNRLMIGPEDSRAKIEIVDALNRLEYAKPDVFLRGLNHRQDHRFGEPPGQDAAGTLRESPAQSRTPRPSFLFRLPGGWTGRPLSAEKYHHSASRSPFTLP